MPRSQPRISSHLLVSPCITSHLLVSARISSHLLALPRISWYPICSSSLLFLCPGASVGKCEPKRQAPMPASYLLASPRISAYHLQTPRITSHLLASCCTCPPLLVSPLYLLASPPMTWCLRRRSMNLNDKPRCLVLILVHPPSHKVLMLPPQKSMNVNNMPKCQVLIPIPRPQP